MWCLSIGKGEEGLTERGGEVLRGQEEEMYTGKEGLSEERGRRGVRGMRGGCGWVKTGGGV